MSFLQIVQSYSGLVSMIFAIASAIYFARFVGKNKASNTVSDAQEKAISAMEARLEVQEKNINDLTKENTRLQLIIETISSALKGMNLVVTIEGELVKIKDENNNSSIAKRMQDK